MSSVKEQVANLMRRAERIGMPVARFFSSGISRKQQAEICDQFGISLTNDTADFFEALNGLNAPPDVIIRDRYLVMNFSPLGLLEACDSHKLAVDYGGMPKEYFPICHDFSNASICVVQRGDDSFREGSVIFWDPESNDLGINGFKSLEDFLKYACISLEQCSLPGGGVDFDCTIVNANNHARMVDLEAKVFWEAPYSRSGC